MIASENIASFFCSAYQGSDVVDLTVQTGAQDVTKSIGQQQIIPPPSLPATPQSSEQGVLETLERSFGNKPVFEFKLQCAPSRIIQKGHREWEEGLPGVRSN